MDGRQLIERAPDAVLLIDSRGRVADVNREACHVLGLPRAELIGKLLDDFDARPRSEEPRRVISPTTSGRPTTIETAFRSGRGELVPIELRTAPLSVDDGGGSIVVAREISERRRARTEVTQSEARLRAIFENEPECVKILDADCVLLDMNPAGLRLIAADALDEVLGLNTLDLVAPEYHDSFQDGVERVFRGEKTFQLFKIIALDGTERWMEQHAVPLWNSADPPRVKEMLAVTRDVTERKRSEKEMLHKQRLEALGTLAGGIAHDLNNLLAPILLCIDELRVVDQGAQRDVLTTLNQSARRASDMVKQLLGFAGGFEVEEKLVHVAPLVGELNQILQATFPKNIEIRISVEDDIPAVQGDETQLQQVLLNLCVNARDAMQDGGRLEVSARTASPRGDEGSPTETVVFEVRDSGDGIPESIRDTVFEPFFSTKSPDQGTGLGLSSALGIVTSHGGTIELESEEGRGSTFRVSVPACSRGPMLEEAAHRAVQVEGRGRKVLLIDDEDAILSMTERVLSRLGFETIRATNGDEGLQQLERHGHQLAAVLSDLRMPGVNGMKILRRARVRYPNVRLILTTGHLDRDVVGDGGDIEGLVSLEKPYSVEALCSALATALA